MCFYIKVWNKQLKSQPNNDSRIISLTETNKIIIHGVNEKIRTIKYFDFNLKLSENHKYKPTNGNIKLKKARSTNKKSIPTPWLLKPY